MLNLPVYRATDQQKKHVSAKKRTAKLIRFLWDAADKRQRSSKEFLSLLVKCGWTTHTPRWRNKNLAKYLGVTYTSDAELASGLCEKLPRLSASVTTNLLRTSTGATHYPNFYHGPALQFVQRNSDRILQTFQRVSRSERAPEEKAFAVASKIETLGKIRSRKGWLSPFNALTPTLSCLDPQRRFPIMNQKTESLLRRIGRTPDADGVRKLVHLIGDKGITNSFVLDAYALYQKLPPLPRRPKAKNAEPEYRDLGVKSEAESIARINARKTTITKRHNALTNDFRDALLWTQRITPKEHRFDAVLEDWKKGRDLLVEAKTASEGPAGRMQVRQAIGQLFDYRFTYFSGKKVDMAILLRKRPSESVRELLVSLRIECLWFDGKRLAGTIQLTSASE